MTQEHLIRANVPPKELVDDVFTFSASGIATSRGCLRKASYRYVLNVNVPSNASAALGTKIHKEMEDWFLEKRIPVLAPTKRLLPLAPNPTHPDVLVEHPFRILLPVGAARGFIDLVVPRPVPRLMPDGEAGGWSEDRPAVYDWKSTSNLVYAKSETDLLKDPQTVLYGVAARLTVAKRVSDVPEVDLQWTYTSTKAAESRPVRLRQTLTILEDGLAEVIVTAEKMKAAFAEAAPTQSVDEIEYDLRECDRYGGCPHKTYCTANLVFVATGSGPPLDGEVSAPTVAPAPLPERKPIMADSSILARLRAGAKTPPKTSEPPPPAETAPEAPEPVEASPEPALPHVDVTGLDVPLPTGSAPINSPQASPNVSPEDPPPPPPHANDVPTAKARKGKASPKGGVLELAPAGVENLRATLTFHAQRALTEGSYDLALRLTAVLADI